jgi:hypothetical protein
MTVAQGINKVVSYKKQVALGSPASGGSGQKLRRTSFVPQSPRDTFESNEIASHQQSTGASLGVHKPTAKLDGLLSPATYKDFFGSILRRDFAAVADMTALSLTIAASGSDYTITRSTGSWLSGGVKNGMVIRITAGSFTAGTTNKNLLVLSVDSATVLTVKVVNGSTLTAEGPIATSTVAVPGKRTYAASTGHTTDWYTLEDFYSDLTKSETYEDTQVGAIAVGLPATGNATVSIDFISRKRQLNNAQILTTPTAETTTPVLTAVNGVVLVNGAAVANVTGAQLNIGGNVSHSDPTLGSNYVDDLQRGRVTVTGQFTAKFDGTTLQAIKDAGTTTSLTVLMTEDASADADFVTFTISKLKLTGDTPDDGEKAIIRTYTFVAEINGDGGTALANDNSILAIQDSAA